MKQTGGTVYEEAEAQSPGGCFTNSDGPSDRSRTILPMDK